MPTDDVQLAEKRRRAADLRLGGASYERIAEALGYAGPSGAYQAVQAALGEPRAESTAELLRLELERLDQLQASLWPAARKGDQGAVDRVLRVMHHRRDSSAWRRTPS